MKKNWTLGLALLVSLYGYSQIDSTEKKPVKEKSDTIRIGNITIINNNEKDSEKSTEDRVLKITTRKTSYKPSNIRTNWWIVDLGFANYDDRTNYNMASTQQFSPGANEDWFNLKNGKSVNVNLWVFMQRLNLINHVVNLKYGLGLELNNYRYESPIKYQTNPTRVVFDNSKNYEKNKLAADYITVPLMLNFNFTPERNKGFGLSVGTSAGYLYSSRQKTITSESGKNKEKDDFDLRQFKLSYIGELHLGPVKLYGSLATKSMFDKGLDQKPYNIGIRFSNW